MLYQNKDQQEVQKGSFLQYGKILYPDSPIKSQQILNLPKYSFQPKIEHLKGVHHIPSIVSIADSAGQSSLYGYDQYDTDSYESPDSQDSPTVQDGQIPFEYSLLDLIIYAEWEQRLEQGIFRYDVTSCPNKIIDGRHNYIAQLNEGRANKKRATEFQVDQVVQQFDDNKFNFTKALQKEVLFMFEAGYGLRKSQFEEQGEANSSANLVMINISPIDYGHVLLIPRIKDQLPQLVNYQSMSLVLEFAQESNNRYFRIGYNSLGAYGTINHLHFQAYYNNKEFPVEKAKFEILRTRKCNTPKSVQVSQLVDYPVRGLVFETQNNFEGLAQEVNSVCSILASQNTPHNFLVCEAGRKVFLWPQCYAERQANNLVPQELLDCGVNPACFEIAGHLVMKRKEDYDELNEKYINRLLEQVSLSEERFKEIIIACFG